ncbi:hypothetical protein TNIN_342301, partial [Trichonephila inaurata madagascariensis]
MSSTRPRTSGNVGRASAQQIRPSDPHRTPFSRGTIQEKSIFFTPSARQMFAFQHFSSPLCAFNLHTKASTGRGLGDFQPPTPFTGHKKGG